MASDAWGGSWLTSWAASWGAGVSPPPPAVFVGDGDGFEALDRATRKRRKEEREDREELRRLIVEAVSPAAPVPVIMDTPQRVARLSTGAEFYVPPHIDFPALVQDITAAVVGRVRVIEDARVAAAQAKRRGDDEFLLLF